MAGNTAQRPRNWFFNTTSRRWELRGTKIGDPLMAVGDDGLTINAPYTITSANITTGSIASATIAQGNIAQFQVGGGGTLSYIKKFVGTLTGIAAVGTAAVAVGTMTGIGSAGIAVGDLVLVVPKVALAGHIGFVGAYVPSINTINVLVANTKPDSAGSFVAVGVDALIIRSSA